MLICLFTLLTPFNTLQYSFLSSKTTHRTTAKEAKNSLVQGGRKPPHRAKGVQLEMKYLHASHFLSELPNKESEQFIRHYNTSIKFRNSGSEYHDLTWFDIDSNCTPPPQTLSAKYFRPRKAFGYQAGGFAPKPSNWPHDFINWILNQQGENDKHTAAGRNPGPD